MNDEQTLSPYRRTIRTLRAALVDEADCLYFLHTPQGRIHVSRWNYAVPGMVAVTGEDEGGTYRFLLFTEQAIASFPIEIERQKNQAAKSPLGFQPALSGTEDRA